VQALLDAGRPVLMLAPHFVGLDAGGVAIAMRFNSASIYAVQSNPVFDRLLLRGRQRFGDQLLLSRQESVRASVRAMKAGRPLYYLPDMDFGKRDSIFVPFFGVQTATVPGLSRLARLAGAVVVPCVTRLLPGGEGYAVTVGEPWQDFPFRRCRGRYPPHERLDRGCRAHHARAVLLGTSSFQDAARPASRVLTDDSPGRLSCVG
jgi:KDO2-lipid IV(A) lauroyltransferase